MIIKTKDFTLRPIRMSDAERYWEIMQDKETKKGFMSVPKDFKEAKKEVEEIVEKCRKKDEYNFAIDIGGKYCGSVVVQYQNHDKKGGEGRMHMWLHPEIRGKGIGTKALMEGMKFGFNKLKFKRIFVQCKASNKAMVHINEKVGFKIVKTHYVEGIKKILWVKER